MGIGDTHYVFPPDIGSDPETVRDGYGKEAEKSKRGGRLMKFGSHLGLVSKTNNSFSVPSF
jgi:hypothetical protein